MPLRSQRCLVIARDEVSELRSPDCHEGSPGVWLLTKSCGPPKEKFAPGSLHLPLPPRGRGWGLPPRLGLGLAEPALLPTQATPTGVQPLVSLNPPSQFCLQGPHTWHLISSGAFWGCCGHHMRLSRRALGRGDGACPLARLSERLSSEGGTQVPHQHRLSVGFLRPLPVWI